MDYKQKYEEALKNINKIKTANKDNKELVDFIEFKYPELKESEDERIRKEIISYLRGCCGAGSEDHLISKRKQWIVWLEKQCVQKVDKCAGCNNVKGCITCTDGDQYAHITEQKPTWNEEDEMIECLNNCLDELEEANGWRFIYVNNKDVELCEVRNWLKSIKERMKGE